MILRECKRERETTRPAAAAPAEETQRRFAFAFESFESRGGKARSSEAERQGQASILSEKPPIVKAIGAVTGNKMPEAGMDHQQEHS